MVAVTYSASDGHFWNQPELNEFTERTESHDPQ